MGSTTRPTRYRIGTAISLWLLFASVLSLPYLFASILPNESYYWLKDHFGFVVLLVKRFVDILVRFTN
jgi:hypothetical protein